jgi:hypothetical protein
MHKPRMEFVRVILFLFRRSSTRLRPYLLVLTQYMSSIQQL